MKCFNYKEYTNPNNTVTKLIRAEKFSLRWLFSGNRNLQKEEKELFLKMLTKVHYLRNIEHYKCKNLYQIHGEEVTLAPSVAPPPDVRLAGHSNLNRPLVLKYIWKQWLKKTDGNKLQFNGERVRTSKITSSKVKKRTSKVKKNIKNQNVESLH